MGARGEKNPPVDQATRHHRVVPEHLDQDLPGAESVVHPARRVVFKW
jgi:hypothetical protein